MATLQRPPWLGRRACSSAATSLLASPFLALAAGQRSREGQAQVDEARARLGFGRVGQASSPQPRRPGLQRRAQQGQAGSREGALVTRLG